MLDFEEEFIHGSIAQKSLLKLPLGSENTEIGPGSYMAVDIRPFEREFDLAEVRAMGRSGLILRSLARKLVLRTGGLEAPASKAGIYLLTHDGAISSSYLRTALTQPELRPSELLSAMPPKLALQLSGCLNAAQIAIETRARGPILCVHPTRAAIDFLIEEIAIDRENGLLDHCFVGLAVTYEDPLEWPITLPEASSERAIVMSLSEINDSTLARVRGRMKDFL